jgi:hypothetical protein
VNKFMKRHKLSLKLVGNAKSSELGEDTIEAAVVFLDKVEFLTSNVHPSKIKVHVDN